MESFKLKVKILTKKCHISINLTLSNLKSNLLVQTLLCIKSKFLSHIPPKIIRKLRFSSDFRGEKSQFSQIRLVLQEKLTEIPYYLQILETLIYVFPCSVKIILPSRPVTASPLRGIVSIFPF